MAVIFRDKFWPKFQQEFSPKFQQEFLPKFQNFGSNLNKIFYKILVNLNILPIIFAVVLLSLLQYYNKIPVRNLVSISAILLLKYCYTFSYRLLASRIGIRPIFRGSDDTGYQHDCCADKDSLSARRSDSYPHDGPADKDSYPHDRHNQYVHYV